MDNIIEQFSDKTTKKYQLTRIWDILDIFRNLELGVPVPVLVNDAIYLDDSNESTNRYVLLVGIDKEFAIVLDSEFAKKQFCLLLSNRAISEFYNLLTKFNMCVGF